LNGKRLRRAAGPPTARLPRLSGTLWHKRKRISHLDSFR